MAEKSITKEQQRILDSQFMKDPNASNEKLRQLGIIINLPRSVVLKYFQQRRKWTDLSKNFEKLKKDDKVNKKQKMSVHDSRDVVMTRSRTRSLLRKADDNPKTKTNPKQKSFLPRTQSKLRSSLPKPDKWLFDDLGLRSNDQFTTSTPKIRPVFATSTPKPILKAAKANLKPSRISSIKLEIEDVLNLSEIHNA